MTDDIKQDQQSASDGVLKYDESLSAACRAEPNEFDERALGAFLGDQETDGWLNPDRKATREPLPDSMQTYLSEIGRVQLLTVAEEIELADSIARGKAAKKRLESSDA